MKSSAIESCGRKLAAPGGLGRVLCAGVANHATFGHAVHFTVEIISLESTLIKNGTQELSQTTGGSKLAPVALDCTTSNV